MKQRNVSGRRRRRGGSVGLVVVLSMLLGSGGLRANAEGPEVAFRDVAPRITAGGGGFVPFSKGHVVIFLATEGVTIQRGPRSDASANMSPLCGAMVPPFDTSPFGASRAAVIADLASRVIALFADFDVSVVTTRPAAGPYNLVALGGKSSLCGLAAGYSGYAPLDCDNAGSRQDVAFVFSEGITHLGMLAVIIAHEIGHAHGLLHTDEACDVMSNLLCNPDEKRFFDKEMRIAPDHIGRCGMGKTMNSHARLMAVIGPSGGGVRDAASDGGSDTRVVSDGDARDGRRVDGARGDGVRAADADVVKKGGGGGAGGCVLAGGMGLASRGGARQLFWPALVLWLMICRRRRRRGPDEVSHERAR